MPTIFVTLFIFALFVVIVSLVRTSINHCSRRSRPVTGAHEVDPGYQNHELPDGLELQPGVRLQPAAARLEAALGPVFREQLKARVLRKVPRMSPAEFDWIFLELKRYFMMTALMKQVPMYSEAVDEIWHEMLLFTRDYHRFGESFIGSVIHHAPHSEGIPNPGERAWVRLGICPSFRGDSVYRTDMERILPFSFESG